MGVDGLWSLVGPVGKDISLETCAGKKLAVDLSAWIMQCSLVAKSKTVSPSYLCCRGIFMRTINLLSLGIGLVFVIDGPIPPQIKKKVHSREEFYKLAMEYKELLTSLGLPVLVSDGEAEKLCAKLNQAKLVDGVLTNDGDALIYGAQTVYKGLFQEKKDHFAKLYKIDDITSSLNLSTRDLVAFALLSSGDFNAGVPNVREKRFSDLMKEFQDNGVSDALDRLKSWASSAELNDIKNKKDLLNGNKRRHCTTCDHEGTKQQHKSSGCVSCQFEMSCEERNAPGHPQCPCQYHVLERTVMQHKTELKIRELALRNDPTFPDLMVVAEFLEPLPPQSLADLDLTVRRPDFEAVCNILQQKINYDFCETMKHLAPATIKMALHGLLSDVDIKPICILKTVKVNGEQCYMIRWQKLDKDVSSKDDYEFNLPQKVINQKYPEMVESYRHTNKHKVDKPGDNARSYQPKITSMFSTVKKPTEPQNKECLS